MFFALGLIALPDAAWAGCWDTSIRSPSDYEAACACEGGQATFNPPQCHHGGTTTAPVTPPNPRQVALQQAIPRYNALVISLADKSILDKQSWLNLPLATEADFFSAANQLHKLLVNQVDGNRFRVGKLRENLDTLNQRIATYPGLIESSRADIKAMRLERERQAEALKVAEQQLELAQRTSKQLEAHAARYAEDVKSSKGAILGAMAVLLPPALVAAASPPPYGSALDWTPAIPERRQEQETEPASPIQVASAVASRFGVRLDINPAPLTGTAEDAAAQLEADTNELSAAMAANTWDLANEVDARQPVAAQLDQELKDTTNERDGLAGDVKAAAGQLKQATWALLLAHDNLKANNESFVYQAAEAWIWENAKTEAIQQVKDETRRRVAAKWIGVPYRDLSDEEMRALFSAGKQNIFGLADKALSSGDGLYEVMNRIATLQSHGEGYAQEAVRLASLGSPREIMEFVDGMFAEMDDDSEQLVKANLGAMDIPEPWKSISAKYFVRKTAE